MTGETEKDVSGWTVDTLATFLLRIIDERDKQYDQRFDAQEKATVAALAAAEKAIDKRERDYDKRFDGVNEFRKTLSDQASLFMPRTEYDSAHDNLVERVDDLRDRFNKSEGKGVGLNAGWIYILGGLAAIGTLVSLMVVFLAI